MRFEPDPSAWAGTAKRLQVVTARIHAATLADGSLFGDRVSLVYRDFPPRQIHSQAELAAEASRCALEQEKYWEYHDQIFARSKLDKDALIEFARNVKLDEKQFGSCLASEKYKADIKRTSRAGRRGSPGRRHFSSTGLSAPELNRRPALLK